jgi:hypothetical protein
LALGAPAPGRPNGFQTGAFSAKNTRINNEIAKKNQRVPFSCFHCCCFFSINRCLYTSSFGFTEGGSGGLFADE